MNITELKTILEKHQHWIREDCDGWEKMRANLSEADLCGADLREADLRGAYLYGADLREADLYGADLCEANLSEADLREADLRGANLSEADLCGADLREADLRGANLCGAYLYGADLYGADLCEANLSEADLCGADLREADLRGANLCGANLSEAKIDIKLINKFFPLCCPEYGEFIAWKKANEMIIKLKIPEDAKRSSAFGRKCRASKAVCLAIENADGTQSGVKTIPSNYDGNFIYKVGEIVEVENFDDDRTHECASGIHFFITRQEAVDYY